MQAAVFFDKRRGFGLLELFDDLIESVGGQVAERGTHAALLAQGGTYARLWAVQSGERLPDEGGSPP